MKSNNDFDAILDNATSEIRNESVDSAVVDKAAERVWTRLASETSELKTNSVAAARIGNCADFQSLIPAYLTGSLSEARSLLLVDHTHECIPCRKAMKDARSRRMAPAKKAAATRRYSIQPVVLRWGIAAMLVIGVGLIALPFIQRWSPLGGNLEATVQAAEGQVYQIADTSSAPLTVGEKLQKGAGIHTADAGDSAGTGLGEKPVQFSVHLHREFTRWRDNEGQWFSGALKSLIASEQGRREGQSKRHRLA